VTINENIATDDTESGKHHEYHTCPVILIMKKQGTQPDKNYTNGIEHECWNVLVGGPRGLPGEPYHNETENAPNERNDP